MGGKLLSLFSEDIFNSVKLELQTYNVTEMRKKK